MQNAILGVLILTFLALGWMGRSVVEIASGDEFTYLALSHSLEDGSYREIYRASQPLHVQYPPGYPAWLLVVRNVSGERLDLIPAVNLALVSLTLLMVFGAARKLIGGWMALGMLLPLSLSAGLLWTGGSYYSEALFLFLSATTVVATLRADESGAGWRYTSAAIVLALLAFLTRAIGLTLIVGVGLWLLSRRRRRELVALVVSAALVVGGWMAHTSRPPADVPIRSYGSDFLRGRTEAPPDLVTEVAHRVWDNALMYSTQILPVELAMPTLSGTVLDNALWLALNALFLSVGLVVLWRRWRALMLYLVLSAAALLLWPWPLNRLLAPLIPFLMLTFMIGAWTLCQRLSSHRARVAALASLVLALTLGATQTAIAHVGRLWDCDRDAPYTSAGCYDAPTLGLIAASMYLKDSIAVDDAVLAWRPSSIHFLSGRAGEPATLVERFPEGQLADSLRSRGIRYALLGTINEFERESFARALMASCADFQVEARFEPNVLLLRTRSPGEVADTADSACGAIDAYQRATSAASDTVPSVQ